VNVLKGKELTNVRAAGRDDNILLTLEKALAYIEDDELVEVTPGSICLRKRYLDPNERKKAERLAAS
jgi:GTP-binding protein